MEIFLLSEAGSIPALGLVASTRLVDYSQLFHCSPLGTMITNGESRILYVNPVFEKSSGYSLHEIMGFTPQILHSGKHNPGFYHEMWRSIQVWGCWQGEIWNRKKHGEIFAEWLSISRINNGEPDQTWYLGQFFDISQTKQKEALLHYEATHDSLTGLANNVYMRRHLDIAVTKAEELKHSVAVLYIDLDGFKSVNDSRGHLEGDCVLKSFASNLRSCVRDTDFVARAGGDEFVVVLDLASANEDAAFEVAEKILDTVSQSSDRESGIASVGCSIGISIYPGNGSSVNELLKMPILPCIRPNAKAAAGCFVMAKK